MGEPHAPFSTWSLWGATGLSTFVSVGNAIQPFSRLLKEIALIASTLPQPVVVQHGNTPFVAAGCKSLAFTEMGQFERLVRDAELLIVHAGAGSVIHAVHAGKVPVVVPRRRIFGEHVDDHQLEFARALGEAGKILVAETPEELGQVIRCALLLQRSPTQVKVPSRMLTLVEATLADYAKLFSSTSGN